MNTITIRTILILCGLGIILLLLLWLVPLAGVSKGGSSEEGEPRPPIEESTPEE